MRRALAPALGALCIVVLCAPGMCGLIGDSSFYIGGPGVFPDAAYNSTNGNYLVVWAEAQRIRGRLVTSGGSTSGGAFWISDEGYGALYPAVAYNATDNEFLVVWEQWERPGGAYCQRVNALTGALAGGNFPAGAIGTAARPSVAWNSARNRYLVVYWYGLEIYGQVITNQGAPVGATANISHDAYFSGYPSVCSGPAGMFLVTWDYSPDKDGYIRAQRVDDQGNLAGGAVVVSTLGAEERSNAAYDAENGRWLVQWNEYAYGSDQYGGFVNADGALGPLDIPIAHTPASEAETILGCDIACAPGMGRYFSSYQYSLDGSDGMACQELYLSGEPVGPKVMLANGACFRHSNAVDTNLNRLLTVWDSLEGRDFYIRGQVYEPETDVTSPTPNGAYKAGQTVVIQVTFSRAAHVTGAPLLQLETGAVDRTANYTSGSGTNTLTFRYTIEPGDMAADLDYSSSRAILLNGGTIRDASGADIDLSLAPPGEVHSLGYHKNLVIDTLNPTVTNVTSNSANGIYKQGAVINIQITFTDSIYVTGAPMLEMETGAMDRKASYASGSGTTTLNFVYRVSADDTSPDLDYTSVSALSLNGGTMKDAAGNSVTLALPQPGSPGSLSYNKNIVVDALRPSVRKVTSLRPDGTCKALEQVDINVEFTEPVVVTGIPQLALETGLLDRQAGYVSGGGTPVLTFRYVVQPGDSSPDLDYRASNSLTGTIRDVAGNLGSLSLPAPGASGSLGANKDLIVNTTGSVADAKAAEQGGRVQVGPKPLYLKRSDFAYVEEPDRACGIRIEGPISATEGDLVSFVGSRRTNSRGEQYILVEALTVMGQGTIRPLGASNRSVELEQMAGLFVTLWGAVKPGSVTADSFVVTDGSDGAGIRVITNGAPAVVDGQFVTVTGAAGTDDGRVVYAKTVL